MSGYTMEDPAGAACSCTVEFLFLCFPLVMSIKFHYKDCFFLFIFFSSVRFWFALQIQFQSETWAARLPHGRDETHGVSV